MRKEYDFSKAQRGKFYHKGAKLRLPIYLNSELQNRLERIAQKKHTNMGEIVNQLIRKDMELLQHFT
ncbi:MAG: hypothetical protein HYS08_04950 [Chlamydiae bacterium]|nr:hypothetical protein [Chlamydiota bacterium]MBI3267099.1 hypothetical protein [Chlamydiota bacterium]